MKINKKLRRRIALAIVLGTCFSSVAEADVIYGNSPSADLKEVPSEGIDAIGYNFNCDITKSAHNIYGVCVSNSDAINNVFNYCGGNANEVAGAYATNGKAINNTMFINGGSLYNSDLGTNLIRGGVSVFYLDNPIAVSEANNNSIIIKNFDTDIYGVLAGEAISLTTTECKSVISKADSNTVEINIDSDVNINGVNAGETCIEMYKSNDNIILLENEVSNNKVVVNKGNINHITGGSAVLGIMNDGKNDINIDSNSYINLFNNSVIVNNGIVGHICAAGKGYFGVGNEDGSTTWADSVKNVNTNILDNKVIINNGNIGTADVFQLDSSEAALNIKNNSLIINGGNIGSITGGVIQRNYGIENITSSNNTVNWYGGDITGSISGYYLMDDNNQNTTLPESYFNFYASNRNCDKTIRHLGYFENYNFYLDNTVTANATLINLTGNADLRNSNVGVAVLGSSPLKTGDSVTLLSANSKGAIQTSDNLKNDTSHMRAENISAVYDFTLKNDGMKLTATVGNATPDTNTTDTNTTDTSGINTNPKAENLMEGRAAEAFMTYDKLDIVDKAYQASKHSSTPTTFLDYSYSDVTTKDNTKLRGMNMVWGAASTIGGEKDQGNTLTRGVFLEYGDNSFSSDDHYYNGSIWGSGKGKKTGIGVLLRKVMFDRHYYDAYLRAGTLNTDYSALAEGVGRIKYDNKDLYVSGHLGYGQFIQLTPNLQMDAYAKYFYNRIPSHSTTAYTNDIDAMPISFDTFSNHRLRLGSKFTWDYMDSNNYLFYVDAAIEHERSSDQSGTINGRRISKSNESGTTGVIELGYENNFGFNNAFKFTAKAQGYLGDRRGVGASANISYSF